MSIQLVAVYESYMWLTRKHALVDVLWINCIVHKEVCSYLSASLKIPNIDDDDDGISTYHYVKTVKGYFSEVQSSVNK